MIAQGRVPFLAHGLIGLAPPRRKRGELRPRQQARKRPYRSAADQWRGIIQQPLRFRCERVVAGIADRDQHIAQETLAPDALDRRFGKQRAEIGVIEPRQIGEPRRAQVIARE